MRKTKKDDMRTRTFNIEFDNRHAGTYDIVIDNKNLNMGTIMVLDSNNSDIGLEWTFDKDNRYPSIADIGRRLPEGIINISIKFHSRDDLKGEFNLRIFKQPMNHVHVPSGEYNSDHTIFVECSGYNLEYVNKPEPMEVSSHKIEDFPGVVVLADVENVISSDRLNDLIDECHGSKLSFTDWLGIKGK